MADNSGVDKRITFGIILIIIGGIFLLSTLDVIDFRASRIIFHPSFILLVVGILILVNSAKKAFGGILAGVGFFWILPRVFPQLDYGPELIIPVLLICIGIYFIFKHSQKKTDDGYYHKSEKLNKDMVDDVAIFGGGNKAVRR